MYIHYSTGNNSGLRTLVHIVEVSVIGGVHFRRFHCSRVAEGKNYEAQNSNNSAQNPEGMLPKSYKCIAGISYN